MEFERGRTRSHSVGNLLWKRLWTCCKTLCSSNKFVKQITRHRTKLRWVYANIVLLHHFPALKMEGSGFSEISVTLPDLKVSHPRRWNFQFTAVKTSKTSLQQGTSRHKSGKVKSFGRWFTVLMGNYLIHVKTPCHYWTSISTFRKKFKQIQKSVQLTVLVSIHSAIHHVPPTI